MYGTLVDIRTDEYSQKFRQRYLKYLERRFGAGGAFFGEYFSALSSYTGFAEPDIVQVLHRAITASGGNLTFAEAEEAALKFRKLSTFKLGLYRGVKRLLKTLKERGAEVYLLSNAQAVFTVYELKKLGIYSFFDGVELSSDFGQKKPSGEFFGRLVDKYSLDPAKTVFVGNDISCDIVPSRAQGMYAVYIKSAISPAEDTLERAETVANFVAESFSAAAEHLISKLN